MGRQKNVIKYNGEKFTLIKQYPNFGLYEDKNGMRTCFSDFDLGLVKEIVEPPKSDTRKYLLNV